MRAEEEAGVEDHLGHDECFAAWDQPGHRRGRKVPTSPCCHDTTSCLQG
jgi:hypothetical protein